MTDAGSSMSLTAVLVLTVVVLVTMAGWLGTIFFVGREPRSVPGGDGTAAQAGHSPAPAGRASGGHR